MGIVVVGPVFVDIKGFPLGTFIQNGRNSGEVETVHGGISRNIVEDIANVELRPTFLSLVDDTGTGEDVIKKLNNHKVDTRYIKRVKDGMGIWLAVFNNEGDVVASISKRPDFIEIERTIDEFGEEIFKDCDSITVEIDIEPSTIKKIIALAKKYNKKVYGAVSNMSIAVDHRDLFKDFECIVCNIEEAELLFSEDYSRKTPSQMSQIILDNIIAAKIPSMVVTMGENGAVYASVSGVCGVMPSMKVNVIDTTGAGDAFFSGVAMGLTYGKDLKGACEIGTRLAACVIQSIENVCPRFLPEEFGLKK